MPPLISLRLPGTRDIRYSVPKYFLLLYVHC